MVAGVDLWVYNAEIFCVSFLNQVASIFHLRGGEIKNKFFLAHLSVYNVGEMFFFLPPRKVQKGYNM